MEREFTGGRLVIGRADADIMLERLDDVLRTGDRGA